MPVALREVEPEQRPRRGQEAGVGILGHQPGLDRVAPHGDGEAVRRQPLAARDAQLPGDEVLAGHELRDGMLDLEPRVDLQEVRAPVRREQELDRRGPGVAGRHQQPPRGRLQLRLQRGVDVERRRLLEHLLVASLQRAVAQPERGRAALPVAEGLHLHVPGALQVALQVQRGRRRTTPPPRARAAASASSSSPAARTMRIPRPPPPATAFTSSGRPTAVGSSPPGTGRKPASSASARAARLVAERAQRGGRRADEDDARGGAGLGELGALREEAVAGVQRVAARAAGRVDERAGVEVRGRGRRRSDAHRGVGEPDVRQLGVGVGVHGDRAEAELAAGADHARGDLGPVGDEHAAQGHHMRKTPKRVSGSGARAQASRARPSTRRVSRGSMTPSSQSRAVAW